jgi:hypothetical protein
MAAITVKIDFNGPGNYSLAAPSGTAVNSLLMVSVTNLGGVTFDFADSDNTQLTGPLIFCDLNQYVTHFGTPAVPLVAAAAGKGLNLRIKDGGRLSGFAVIDVD